jgi:hypothetical protein
LTVYINEIDHVETNPKVTPPVDRDVAHSGSLPQRLPTTRPLAGYSAAEFDNRLVVMCECWKADGLDTSRSRTLRQLMQVLHTSRTSFVGFTRG